MSSEPSPTGRWVLDSAQQGLPSLRYEPASSLARADALSPEDVLVDIRAASLNYRDLVIARGKLPGHIPHAAVPDVIPASDGAGVVVAVGSSIDLQTAPWLAPGKAVATHMVANKADDYMPIMTDITDGLGQARHGTLCRRGVFHRSCLVPMPKTLSFEEAATLTCSGLTAWNALHGTPGRQVKQGDWVLIQGTGGVSVAALQFAVAAGANVIAITSSNERAEKLTALGARHVINYKEEPNWGEVAKSFTPGERGVDHVVDVVGVKTLAQAVVAVRNHGLVTVAGMVGGGGGGEYKDPGIMSALWKQVTFRGILLGSRQMFLDMVSFLEKHQETKPAIDDVIFSLEEAKQAYERLDKWEHFSKVIIVTSPSP